VHAPSDAGRLHAKQPAVQALLQQTPSAQKPLAHSSPRAHRLPRIFFPHEPLRQTAGASHSPLPAQVSAQRCFSASQRKGAQSRVGGVSQPPAPHTPSGVQRLAAGSQPPGLQTVPVGYFWQAPAPSQWPLVPQAAGPWSAQPPPRSAVPAGTGVHCPGVPGKAHERQLPVQAVSQQTPSAQKPDWHWSAVLQGWPGPRRPQLPFKQACGDAQSAYEAHSSRQAPSAQIDGEQLMGVPGAQVPPVSQWG